MRAGCTVATPLMRCAQQRDQAGTDLRIPEASEVVAASRSFDALRRVPGSSPRGTTLTLADTS